MVRRRELRLTERTATAGLADILRIRPATEVVVAGFAAAHPVCRIGLLHLAGYFLVTVKP
jgi:hypothetical protein